jgi:tetratricopeptide (TPR) repeat protein
MTEKITEHDWFNKGSDALDQKDFDSAIKYFSQVIKMNPREVAAYINRGIAYSHKNELERAIANYTLAIGINPKLSEAYQNRGNMTFPLKLTCPQ